MKDIFEINYELKGVDYCSIIHDVIKVDKEFNKDITRNIEIKEKSIVINLKGDNLKKIRSDFQNLLDNIELIVGTIKKFPN